MEATPYFCYVSISAVITNVTLQIIGDHRAMATCHTLPRQHAGSSYKN